jgi:signal peptidase I
MDKDTNNFKENPTVTNRVSIAQNLYEWAKVIVIALLIAMPIRYFIAEPFIVSGASMDPTFSTHQFLIVDRLSYRFNDPKRGDVLIFRYPKNPDTYFIKRLIGFPNETVIMNKGMVTIKDAQGQELTLKESYIDTEHTSFDNLTIKLKDDEYFVMGDNRQQSLDSRAWGPIHYEAIIGKPFIRLFPFNKIDLSPGIFNQYENTK